jgi:hypothetical protein
MSDIGITDLPAFDGNVPAINGCPECNETGYK